MFLYIGLENIYIVFDSAEKVTEKVVCFLGRFQGSCRSLYFGFNHLYVLGNHITPSFSFTGLLAIILNFERLILNLTW